MLSPKHIDNLSIFSIGACATLLCMVAALLAGCATTRTERTERTAHLERTERTALARAAFVRGVPCPATGKPRGACPGYVVDYIKPLCAGGADHPNNLQWQTIADAKVKDAEERQLCRLIHLSR